MNFPRSVACVAVAVTACAATTTSAALTNLVLNGSFENNTAPHPTFNRISDAQFNAYMADCIAYAPSWDYVIESNGGPYGGDSGAGNWHIALSTAGGMSMALSQSLVAGNYYEVSFKYTLLNASYVNPGDLKVGVSTSPTSLGSFLSLIAVANKGSWATRTFGFIASQEMNGANRLTFSGSMNGSDPFTWIGIDNVSLTPAPGALAVLGIAGLTGRRRRA